MASFLAIGFIFCLDESLHWFCLLRTRRTLHPKLEVTSNRHDDYHCVSISPLIWTRESRWLEVTASGKYTNIIDFSCAQSHVDVSGSHPVGAPSHLVALPEFEEDPSLCSNACFSSSVSLIVAIGGSSAQKILQASRRNVSCLLKLAYLLIKSVRLSVRARKEYKTKRKGTRGEEVAGIYIYTSNTPLAATKRE